MEIRLVRSTEPSVAEIEVKLSEKDLKDAFPCTGSDEDLFFDMFSRCDHKVSEFLLIFSKVAALAESAQQAAALELEAQPPQPKVDVPPAVEESTEEIPVE